MRNYLLSTAASAVMLLAMGANAQADMAAAEKFLCAFLSVQGAELVIIRGCFEGKIKAQCIDIEQVRK